MTQFDIDSSPSMGEVLLEQIRVVGLSLRREAAVLAFVLSVVTIAIAVDIAQGTAAFWFDSDEWAHLGIMAFILPFVVWRGERRFGPAFLWTLPFDRRHLALAKVLAGWVWLMVVLAGAFLWQLTLAAVSNVAGARIYDLVALPGTTALYLLGSAVVLGLRHPLRWLIGAAGLLLLLGLLDGAAIERAELAILEPFVAAIRAARMSLRQLPEAAQKIVPSLVYISAGCVALWLAVSRHGERRRH